MSCSPLTVPLCISVPNVGLPIKIDILQTLLFHYLYCLRLQFCNPTAFIGIELHQGYSKQPFNEYFSC